MGSMQKLNFQLNGKSVIVDPGAEQIDPQFSLLEYIRDRAMLKGTKYMCKEGGCGACLVRVKKIDPITGCYRVEAVNSCLTPLLSADGWDILTVEGVSGESQCLSPLQKAFLSNFASQCGFCTPGFLMSIQSLLERTGSFTLAEAEEALDGNMCRCTGYRPILDVVKSLSSDACSSCSYTLNLQDIEDLQTAAKPPERNVNIPKKFNCPTSQWIKPKSLHQLLGLLECFIKKNESFQLIAGNTGTGLVKPTNTVHYYIDINEIPELKTFSLNENALELGSGITYTKAISLLEKVPNPLSEAFGYANAVAKHLRRIAGTSIRNMATLGGNLMLSHEHRDFPFDLLLLLEGLDAGVKIAFLESSSGQSKILSVSEFMGLGAVVKEAVIVSIILKPLPSTAYYFRSFKIAPRYQNALASVNACFLLNIEKQVFGSKQRLVFGGISKDLIHAKETELHLRDKPMSQETLTTTLQVLSAELQSIPDFDRPTYGSMKYRQNLALALFYKGLLGILNEVGSVSPCYRSGGYDLVRKFSTERQQTLITENMESSQVNVDGHLHVTGRAQYVNDIPKQEGELSGVFVLSQIAKGVLEDLDPTEVLEIPGVKAFISAKDIPGSNSYAAGYTNTEKIFAEESITYFGQPVGLILADSCKTAQEAAKRVRVLCSDVKSPSTKMQPIKEVKSSEENQPDTVYIKGTFRTSGQYHMHMETQSCLCIPTEDGLTLHPATQSPNQMLMNVAAVTGLPMNKIQIKTKRLGGGFGGKNMKSSHVASAAAVAALVTKRPVRIVLDLETNMTMIGKRAPYIINYEATVSSSGNIRSIFAAIAADHGSVFNEWEAQLAKDAFQSCYNISKLSITTENCITDKPPNTHCRAPGSVEGVAAIECILDHIAHRLGKDPLELRMQNLLKVSDAIYEFPGTRFKGDNPLKEMIQSRVYNSRKASIEDFNSKNRWRKKGIALTPMRWFFHYLGWNNRFPVFVSVASDGTVSVTHAGVEMGQGINTKCSQVVAETLNIPISMVKVKGTDCFVSPNIGNTIASMTSEVVCRGAIKACKNLLEKMNPSKERLQSPSWENLVTKCIGDGVLLTSQYQEPWSAFPEGYDVWATCLTEVEVDVLTGEYKVTRVDINEDTGKSMNPSLDIGQIEGAFIMGLGLHTTENIIYDQQTGDILSRNTWTYYPPLSKDIPEEFRVNLFSKNGNPLGVLNSKATGEPATCLGVSVINALRQAIFSARADKNNYDWFELGSPVTPERVVEAALTDYADFKILL